MNVPRAAVLLWGFCSRVMPWSQTQQRRLSMEKGILEKYFPGRVTWIDPQGSTKVEVAMNTNNGKAYTLRVYVPGDCLNSCPVMVVRRPSSPLTLRNGDQVPCSGDYHCWGKHDGYTQICHYRACNWTSSNTLYQVFMKGRIWLEAYEGHLRTGRALSAYLAEMH